MKYSSKDKDYKNMIIKTKEEPKIIEDNFWALNKYDKKIDFGACDNVDKGGHGDAEVCTRQYKLSYGNNIGTVGPYDIYDVRSHHKPKHFSVEIEVDDLLNNIDEKKKANETLLKRSDQQCLIKLLLDYQNSGNQGYMYIKTISPLCLNENKNRYKK